MQLKITHETCYDYAPAVDNAQHMCYLQPVVLPTQALLGYELKIEPEPAHQIAAQDVYGNTRHFFCLQNAHTQLRVTKGGIAYISSGVVGGTDIDHLLFRLETWAKGSGYVGRVAASDEVWVMQIFNALKENWPNPPYDYIDIY